MVTGTLTGFIYSVTFSTNSMVHLRSSLISLAYAFGASAVNIACALHSAPNTGNY